MAYISKSGAIAVQNLLREKHETLLQVMNGTDLSEHELAMYELGFPHVSVVDRKYRIALGEMELALQEARRLLEDVSGSLR
jgi:hypothetical protein